MNGIKLSINTNHNTIDTKKPSGGWRNVFEDLRDNLHLLGKYSKCYILLLMDFDDKDKNSLSSFEKRMDMLNNIVPQEYADRVFLLGVNHKESEDLKKLFNSPDFEKIGQKLVKDCPEGDLSIWENDVLMCNLSEIWGMKKANIFEWFFR